MFGVAELGYQELVSCDLAGEATEAISVARDGGRFALVLGAGGPAGFAFHSGALLSLATRHKILANDAVHIVGTSAGALTASLIRTGCSARDLYGLATNNLSTLSARTRSRSLPALVDVAVPSFPRQPFRCPDRKSVV